MLRNWTTAPRRWAARTDAPWIRLGAATGEAAGHDELAITVDGTKLEAGKPTAGKVFVADVAGGREMAIQVTATTGPVFEFIPPDAETARQYFQFRFIPHKGRVPFNLTPGRPETKEVSVLNLAGTETAWQAESSAAWLKVAPPAGKVPPQSPIVLQLTAAPTDAAAAAHEATIAITETGSGCASLEVPVSAFVIPPYESPDPPKGSAVPLDGELHKQLMVSYGGVKGAVSTGAGEMEEKLARLLPRAKDFKRYLRGGSPYELVLDLEKFDADAFTALVGFPDRWVGIVGLNFGPGNEGDRVNWEIHVDGKLRTQSGFMGPKDDFRLLVVDGLAKARQLRLVARPTRLPGYALHVFWFDPTFYKAK
jgi:hypothetical protein